jgi:hypothetical protein
MKLQSIAEHLNYPYLVKYEQKNGQKVQTVIYAPNQGVATKSAIQFTPRKTVILSVQRLYKSC